MRNILVVGWGSPLRGDDSFGLAVAQALAERNIPEVEVLVVHQLTPELAEALAGCCAAVFIDASLVFQEVCISQIKTLAATGPIAHHFQPAQLLAWAKTLFGKCPPAWQVSVPVRQLDVVCKSWSDNSLRIAEAVEVCLCLIRCIQADRETSHDKETGLQASATISISTPDPWFIPPHRMTPIE